MGEIFVRVYNEQPTFPLEVKIIINKLFNHIGLFCVSKSINNVITFIMTCL